MMNSLSLGSVLIDCLKLFNSFSTVSKVLDLDAAEYKAAAYLPSKPKTCTGGFTIWAAVAELLKERTWKHYVIHYTTVKQNQIT